MKLIRLFILSVLVVSWSGQNLRAADTFGDPFMVKDINPGIDGSYIEDFTEFNGTVFFMAQTETHGRQLWKSDGTEPGTVMVKYLDGYNYWFGHNLTVANNTLFFTADDGIHGIELWKSNGTEAGTAMVKDNTPYFCGIEPCDSHPNSLIDFNSVLFFNSSYPDRKRGLWKSDGSEFGTNIVRDDIYISNGSEYSIVELNGMLLFNGVDPNDNVGYELWRSDGSEAGTFMIKDLRHDGSSNPKYFTVVDDTLFFVAQDEISGHALWKSDGTEAGTVMVKDIDPESDLGVPVYLTKVGSTLFFAAGDGINGFALWKSDGTEAGTVMVKDINPDSDPFAGHLIVFLTDLNGTLFFTADDGVNGKELWKSDGTEAGTVMVKDIWPGDRSSVPQSLTAINNTLFFSAFDDTYKGRELWKSDGTEAGTAMVKDISPLQSNPILFTKVNRTIFFRADDGVHGDELWALKIDVKPTDMDVFVPYFGRMDCTDDCDGDYNGDGDVDGSDLFVLATDFGGMGFPNSDSNK